MINPTPMLPPSPIEISGFFSASFEAMKRRLGLFVLIVLFPSLLMLAVFLICIMLVGGIVATNNQSAIGTGVVLAFLVFIAGMVAVWLAQLKAQAMMTQAAYEVAQNQQPTFSGVMRNTKGFLPRFVPLILIGFGVALAYALVLGVIVVTMIGSSSSRSSGAGVAAFIFLLLVLLTIPASIVLAVKLLYVVPACTIEGLGGIDSLKRSWNLTKGSFWRTLGYAILPALAVYAVVFVLNSVTRLVSTPVATRLDADSLTPAQLAATLLVLLPAFGISLAVQLAVQLLTTPFLQSYYAYMFIDQVRRAELPAQPFGYGAQPGAGYPGAYPQQGYPQAPQQPPYPGQPYPGQQQYPGHQQHPGAQPYPGQHPPQQQWPQQNPQPGQNDQPGSSQNQGPGQC